METTHPHHTTREKIWVSLRSTHTHFTTCPPDVPFAEASYRSPETLAYVAAALPLYRALGVEVLDDAATLARHVVPTMARLNTQGRAAVLAYVLKHWPRLKDSEALVEALSIARFVDVDEDDDFKSFKSPRDLYDPEVELFALTFKDTPAHFPGKAFRSREWLEVLRTCGIRSAVDAKLFTECATRVAARAAELGAAFPTCADADLMSVPGEKKCPYPRAPRRATFASPRGDRGVAALLTYRDKEPIDTYGDDSDSEDDEGDAARASVLSAGFALAAHLAEHISSLYSVAFCETLAGVPFVPAAFGIPGGTLDTIRCNVLCAFSQGALPEHWAVAFMAKPTMHPSCVPPAFARSALRVRSSVSAGETRAHLLALGAAPARGGGAAALRRWPHDCDLDPEAAVLASLKAVAAAVADGDFARRARPRDRRRRRLYLWPTHPRRSRPRGSSRARRRRWRRCGTRSPPGWRRPHRPCACSARATPSGRATPPRRCASRRRTREVARSARTRSGRRRPRWTWRWRSSRKTFLFPRRTVVWTCSRPIGAGS